MKRILQLMAIVGFVGFSATLSFAGTGATSAPASGGKGACPVCNAAASDNYAQKVGGQLGRGAANAGLCWVELVNQPMKEAKAGGNMLVGVGKGIGHTCIRLVEGVGEIVTSPMPRAKGGKYTQIAHDCPLGVVGMTDR